MSFSLGSITLEMRSQATMRTIRYSQAAANTGSSSAVFFSCKRRRLRLRPASLQSGELKVVQTLPKLKPGETGERWIRMGLLFLIQWGGSERDGSWEETLPSANSHWVILCVCIWTAVRRNNHCVSGPLRTLMSCTYMLRDRQEKDEICCFCLHGVCRLLGLTSAG